MKNKEKLNELDRDKELKDEIEEYKHDYINYECIDGYKTRITEIKGRQDMRKELIKEFNKDIQIMENKILTDNADYISIPDDDYFRFKNKWKYGELNKLKDKQE